MTHEEFRNAMKVTVLGAHGILPANVWVDVCDTETGEIYAMTDENERELLHVFEMYNEEEVMLAEVVKLDPISPRRVTLWVSLYCGE